RAGARVRGLEPVEQRGPAKARGRSTRAVDADQRRARILHTYEVTDDAGVRGPAARQDRRVTRSGFGDRVVLVGVAEGGASLQKRGERALELRPVAVEVVGPQLVDRDHDAEPGPGDGHAA